MLTLSVKRDKLLVFVLASSSCYIVPISFWGDLKWVAMENHDLMPFIPLAIHKVMIPIVQSFGYGLFFSLMITRGNELPLFLLFVLSHNTLGLHQFNLLFALIAFVNYLGNRNLIFAGFSSVFHPSTSIYVMYESIKKYGLSAIFVLVFILYAILSKDTFSVLTRLEMFQEAFNGRIDLGYKVSAFSVRGLLHWTVLVSVYLLLVRSVVVLIVLWFVYGTIVALSEYLHPVLLERNFQLFIYMILIYSIIHNNRRVSLSIRLVVYILYICYFIYYVISAY